MIEIEVHLLEKGLKKKYVEWDNSCLNTALEALYKPTMQFPKRIKIQTNSGMNKNLVAWESFYPVTGHDCWTAMDASSSTNVVKRD